MDICKFLKKYMKPYSKQIIKIIIFTLILLIVKTLSTFFTGKFLDMMTYFPSMKGIYSITIIVLILALINIILSNFNNYTLSKIQAKISFDLNFDILKYIKKLPIVFFKNLDTVYLNQRLNSDSNVLVNYCLTIMTQLSSQIINFIVIIIILANINLKITILSLITIPIYIILYNLFKKPLYESNLQYKEKQNIFFSKMNKQLTNIEFIKSNSLFTRIEKELLESFPSFLQKSLNYIKCSYILSSCASIIENIFSIFLFLYCGYEIINKRMTIGDFVIIKGYYTLILQTISGFIAIVRSYPETLVSYNRINDIIKNPQESNGTTNLDKIDKITLNNINFSYDCNVIIKNFSYVFKKGNLYVIKGKNGVGKSSLIKVLIGIYIDNFEGEIFYNDVNIKDIDLYNTRKDLIGIIDQEPLLITNNVSDELYENVNVEDYEALNNMIVEFNLNVQEKSENKNEMDKICVSGGEKQKLSIIRSLIKKADVIIMDEPTSALDKKSGEILIKWIKKYKSDSIIIVISHGNDFDDISDEIIRL